MVDGAPSAKASGNRLVDIGLMAYARAFEHPCKIRIVKWLIHALAAGRIEIGHVGGTIVAVDPDDYIGWQIFKTGCYEPASLALARRIVAAEPGLFVDVGAHFGWYTLAIASIGGATVIGIEPDSGNCSALRANVARNHLRNITVCNTAVGPEPALLAMSRRAPGNSGTWRCAPAKRTAIPNTIGWRPRPCTRFARAAGSSCRAAGTDENQTSRDSSRRPLPDSISTVRFGPRTFSWSANRNFWRAAPHRAD